MNFFDDPLRYKLEPLHEFLTTWGQWGKFHTFSSVSNTYKIMCWVRDHSKRDAEIEEGIINNEPIQLRDDDRERIANKVEYCLQRMKAECKHREVHTLIEYYRDTRNAEPIGSIARRLQCKPWAIDRVVREALIVFASFWRPEE